MLFDLPGTDLIKLLSFQKACFCAKTVNPWNICTFGWFCKQTNYRLKVAEDRQGDLMLFMWISMNIHVGQKAARFALLHFWEVHSVISVERGFLQSWPTAALLSPNLIAGNSADHNRIDGSVPLLCVWRHTQLASQSGPCQLWFMAFIPGKINLASSLASLL